MWGFDPAFFGISPREAAAMDPQHRLLLQTTFEAFEDAGIRPSSLAGTSTGVFLGLFASDYASMTARSEMLSHLGSSRHAAAGRLAYAWNLVGPALVVDTDRSSGLVALHAACSSLRAGDCDTAIVGAANVILDPSTSIAFARAGMLAPDGRCKFGDASADGFVRSEGVATLVLRPLSRALAEGNPVYAVVRGGASSASGSLAGELMAPSPDAQERLVRAALANAGVRAEDVVYVEAHGTGTPAGDRAELEALGRVLRPSCIVGSIKTNIGHCEPCSGLAGVIKAALAAQHREIPRSLHCRTPVATKLRIATEHVRLSADAPFVAGVSSFGLTGINAHVVIAAPPPTTGSASTAPSRGVLCLSAGSESSLREMARAHADALRGDVRIEDACRSAALHRDHLAYRAAFVAEDREKVIAELEAFADRAAPVARARARRPDAPMVFVYPGHGSQWAGMGRQLLDTSAVFAEKMRECEAHFRKLTGRSLQAELEDPSQFERVEIVQPLLVAIQISLTALWASWGVRPTVVVGTSMGEVVAAHVAGALSLEEALLVTHVRTSLMKTVSGGAMAVVDLPGDAITPRLDPAKVSIGAIYSPTSTAISGERAAVEAHVRSFEAEGVFAKLVRFNVASHSPQMDPILGDLRDGLRALAPAQGSISFFSTVRGRIIDGRELTASYWVDNLRLPVDLASATRALGADNDAVFLEVSPHPVLRSPILEGVAQGENAPLVTFTLERGADELCSALRAAARLHEFGVVIAWDRMSDAGRFVRPPRYRWQNAPYRAALTQPQPMTSTAVVEPPPVTSFVDALRTAPAASRKRVLTAELRREVARLLGMQIEEIDVDRPLREHGLGSASATDLRATLGAWLGRSFSSSLLFNHPTIRALATHLAGDEEPARPQAEAALPRHDVPIALVGMAFRFPRAISSRETFWRLLVEGATAITEIPPDRWDAARYYDPDVRAKGKMHTKWGGFVEDVARFDAELFGISPKEAESMDPQQRMLLELSWEALEDAGLSRSAVAKKPIGVFLGIMNNNEYARRKGVDQRPEDVLPHTSTGDAASIAAGRISYVFGLEGPAISVDTACSSSLVALHLAAQSIHSGESKAALVAGVNVIAHPTTTLSFAKTRMLSPTGRCKTFDAAADGYVRSEGGCVVVLKPLADALAEGDQILAVIRGTAVNQDGRGSGLTAPNGAQQEALVRAALANASATTHDVSYVEAHGTGTPLGDPIEVDSLVRVFSEGRSEPLTLGAVKANIGHLEACAGLAGLVKVVLCMANRTIPQQPSLGALNPKLRVPDWLRIPRENVPWTPRAERLVAGVSSFGFSGTNAHVILEEPPASPAVQISSPREVVLCVSALNGDGLRARAAAMLASPALEREDLAAFAAAASRREHLAARAAVVARSTTELRERLREIADGRIAPALAIDSPAVAFLYGDGRSALDLDNVLRLARDVPAFGAAIARCSTALGEDALRSSKLVTTVAVQIAATAAWREWGIEPEHVGGEGIGEIAAAHAAGIVDEASAIAFVKHASEDVEEAVRRLSPKPPRTTFVSGVIGGATTDAALEASWWRRVVVEAPRANGVATALTAAGANVFIDAGYGEPLVRSPFTAVSILEDGPAKALAIVYAAGLTISWERFYGARAGRTVRLPAYPFARRSYWISPASERSQ